MSFEFLPNEEWQQYHLVQFHKNYVTPEVLAKLKALGIKTMVDFDDYNNSILKYKLLNQNVLQIMDYDV